MLTPLSTLPVHLEAITNGSRPRPLRLLQYSKLANYTLTKT
jgi:hypothetical protein